MDPPPNKQHLEMTKSPLPKEEPENCKFDTKGFCKNHKTLGTKIEVKKSVWKDRGGGRGFGYMKEKVTKFKCGSQEARALSAWLTKAKKNHETLPDCLEDHDHVTKGGNIVQGCILSTKSGANKSESLPE